MALYYCWVAFVNMPLLFYPRRSIVHLPRIRVGLTPLSFECELRIHWGKDPFSKRMQDPDVYNIQDFNCDFPPVHTWARFSYLAFYCYTFNTSSTLILFFFPIIINDWRIRPSHQFTCRNSKPAGQGPTLDARWSTSRRCTYPTFLNTPIMTTFGPVSSWISNIYCKVPAALAFVLSTRPPSQS